MNNLLGEKDEIETIPEEDKNEDEVYVEYDITTYPSDFTLSNIQSIWKSKDIIIPNFQRGYVWTIQQASLLIESFLLGLPVPPVFFYIEEDTQKSLVIDGQQRIMSVIHYFDGFWGEETPQGKRKVFRLEGLNQKSPYYKLKYSDLSEASKRKLSNSVLRAFNIRQLGPQKDNTSIYHIFERLNTGGTSLTPQEIRNCVFRGEIVTDLQKMNSDANWRKILGKPIPDRHQKDLELILRIFSLSDLNPLDYEKPMKEFINKTMKKNRNGSSSQWRKFTDIFSSICALIIENIGESPFHVRGPLNVSVLDSVFCILLNNFGREIPNFKTKYDDLKINKDYVESTQISTSDEIAIKKRMNLVKQAFFP